MENRLATGISGISSLPRVGGVAGDNDNDSEKVYYGFGVFMGLPLADLKAMKDDFVEQQALTGGPPRRALPLSTTIESHTHRAEGDDSVHDYQGDMCMAPPHAQQQQQQHPSHMSGYECQRGEGQQREYIGGSRYIPEPPSDKQGGRDDDADASSDGSDDFGNKSHSLNFILH